LPCFTVFDHSLKGLLPNALENQSLPGVFISYRRDDTQGYAGSLARELGEAVGPELIFLDTEDIVGGTDFPSVLRKAVESSHVLLALIGQRWLTARNARGERRLDDQKDFVRQEISLALQQGVRVIPVLVEGAKIPAEEDLPADLMSLATCNAIELSNSRWDEDIARLTDHIHEAIYADGVKNAALSRIAPQFEAIPPISKNVRRFIAFSMAIGLIFAIIAIFLMVLDRSFAETAVPANAEVVGFHESRSSEGSLTYYPILHFITEDGRSRQVRASVGTVPPAYEIGEHVEILYDPAKLETVVINTQLGRLGIALVFFGFGLLWLLIGGVPQLIRIIRKRSFRFLLDRGRPVTTTFYETEINGSVTVQGRNPYVVVTQWRNPVSQQLVRFRSHQVWEDPTEKAKSRLITVVVDPNNFGRYVMDLSFLHDRASSKAQRL
jgi:hypothetical protein